MNLKVCDGSNLAARHHFEHDEVAVETTTGGLQPPPQEDLLTPQPSIVRLASSPVNFPRF